MCGYISCSSHNTEIAPDNVLLHFDLHLVYPSTVFIATPVSPVPIITTGLSKNLIDPLTISDVQSQPKCG